MYTPLGATPRAEGVLSYSRSWQREGTAVTISESQNGIEVRKCAHDWKSPRGGGEQEDEDKWRAEGVHGDAHGGGMAACGWSVDD